MEAIFKTNNSNKPFILVITSFITIHIWLSKTSIGRSINLRVFQMGRQFQTTFLCAGV